MENWEQCSLSISQVRLHWCNAQATMSWLSATILAIVWSWPTLDNWLQVFFPQKVSTFNEKSPKVLPTNRVMSILSTKIVWDFVLFTKALTKQHLWTRPVRHHVISKWVSITSDDVTCYRCLFTRRFLSSSSTNACFRRPWSWSPTLKQGLTFPAMYSGGLSHVLGVWWGQHREKIQDCWDWDHDSNGLKWICSKNAAVSLFQDLFHRSDQFKVSKQQRVCHQARRSQNQFGALVWQLNEIWPTGGWGFLATKVSTWSAHVGFDVVQ